MCTYDHDFTGPSDDSGEDAPESPMRPWRRKRGCGKPCCEATDGSPHPNAKPLSAYRSGDKVVVDRIERGNLACRLYAMGLTPGTPLTVESSGPGAVRCIVRGASIAIGRGQAEKILCSPAAEGAKSEALPDSVEENMVGRKSRSGREKSALTHPFLRLKGLIT